MLAVHQMGLMFDSPMRYRPLPISTANKIKSRGVVQGGSRR
jgi:hypothetical protein